jgi:hypothetical protein
MYYNASVSARAATILYRRKLVAEAMWGRMASRMASCGGLATRLLALCAPVGKADYQSAAILLHKSRRTVLGPLHVAHAP